MGLCIGELNDDLRNDPKLIYTGTEIRTGAEKVDTIIIVHIKSVIILQHSDKRKDLWKFLQSSFLCPQQRQRDWLN